MATMYELVSDLKACSDLANNAVDENGERRELTEEEIAIISDFVETWQVDYETKYNNICKFIKNLKLEAQNIDDFRKNYKAELDRLSKRAKTAENNAARIQEILRFNMERMGLEKYKTELFTATIQNTQISVKAREGSKLEDVPEKYLKPRELDTTAIKADIKAGKLKVIMDGLYTGRVADENDNVIKGIFCSQNKTLVIR